MKTSGQAVMEYVLLLALVVMMFAGAMKVLEGRDWFEKLGRPLTKDFKNAYQTGHPKSDGKVYVAQDPANIRVFVNPQTEK